MLRDSEKRTLKDRIGRELLGAGKKPGIDFRIDRTQFRLKSRRVALRIVHQKSWIDAEESRQEFARCVRQMGPGAILDLREIRLAQTAANLALHRGGQFLLSHRTAQAAERTFDGAEGAEFVAKFHGTCFQQLTDIIYVRGLFWLAEGLQIDSQLLALLIEMTALQTQRPSYIRHVEVVAPNFCQHHVPFERFGPFGQCAR